MAKTTKYGGLGWVRQLPDLRDYLYEEQRPEVFSVPAPASADLRPKMGPVLDQGTLGSCTVNSANSAVQFLRSKQGLDAWLPSRLFVYYNERAAQGTVRSDSGASIRGSVQALATYGGPPEDAWPYDIAKFKNKPTKAVYKQGLTDKALTYAAVHVASGTDPMAQFKAAIGVGSDPVLIGISVYESFESEEVAKTGLVPVPKSDEELLGGHAVLVVGYDDAQQHLIVRNSWGTGWGDGGYFYLPYSYVQNKNLASDFWVIYSIG